MAICTRLENAVVRCSRVFAMNAVLLLVELIMHWFLITLLSLMLCEKLWGIDDYKIQKIIAI
jgi:hypothetical protein